jgi:hypothetical protein
MLDTVSCGTLHVPASKSLEHFGSHPTRLRGIMPMIENQAAVWSN